MYFDSTQAEYAAIGCALIDSRCIPELRETLPTAESFLSEPCRLVYGQICEMLDKGEQIDVVTVARRTGIEYDFLAQCMNLAPSCAGAGDYARLVREGFRRRRIRELGETLSAQAMSVDADPDQLLNEAGGALESLSRDSQTALLSPGDSLRNFLVFRAEVNEGKRRSVRTGFTSLDGILGGFAQGGLYILAARPGVGKSAFGIALGDMMAKDRQVLYASLEMTQEELNARRIAAVSGGTCTYSKLLFGTTTQEEDMEILKTCGILDRRKLILSAQSSMTVAELESQARRARAEVVMVDYLGLLSGRDPRQTEYERITAISGDLKRMAKRLQCVVIALCQLNRESAGAPGEDKRPRLSQLRSSGAIEQDADGVLLLHRPAYGNPASPGSPTAPEAFFVDVAKNRHGRTGTVELQWHAPVNRFEDRSGRWPDKSWV